MTPKIKAIFAGAQDTTVHQHVGQRQSRSGQQQGRCRAFAHAAADQTLHDEDFGQGGEMHEGAGESGKEVGAEGKELCGLGRLD